MINQKIKTMSLLNKLFKKEKPIVAKSSKEERKITEKAMVEPEKKIAVNKPVEFKSGGVLVSPHTAEKAITGQKLNQYVFKIARHANKISVAKEIKKVYNVKAIKVNIVNIPKKARRVGRTEGFKAGYKKAIITLAKGQGIELK